MNIWDFASEHWFVALLMVWAICGVLRYPFHVCKMRQRYQTIQKQGWPPAHLDADGDFKKEEKK